VSNSTLAVQHLTVDRPRLVELIHRRRTEDCRLLLPTLFEASHNVWIAWERAPSRGCMRRAVDWLALPYTWGRFISPCIYKPGSQKPTAANVLEKPFIVLRSSRLDRDQQFKLVQFFQCYARLRAVVVSCKHPKGNYLLEFWFDRPTNEAELKRLESMMVKAGFSSAAFNARQLCRLPGVICNGSFQTLKYLSCFGENREVSSHV
jgi:hypothetical protein